MSAKLQNCVLGVVTFTAIVAVIVIVGALLTMVFWNYLVDPVMNSLGWSRFPDIGFWTAVGINMIWTLVAGPRATSHD